MTLTAEQLDQVKGAEVTTSDGHQVGVVEAIYLDETSREPEWAPVNTPWGDPALQPLRHRSSRQGWLAYDQVLRPLPEPAALAPVALAGPVPKRARRRVMTHLVVLGPDNREDELVKALQS